jgi:hypothetical protein
MNRFLTIFMVLLAGGALATALSLRGCKSEVGKDGFVLELDPKAVKRIRIQSGTEPVELKRKGSGWQFVFEKTRDQANTPLAEALLQEASLMVYHDRIPGAEISDKDELAEFGVRSPKRWIEFDGPRPVKILFGKDAALEGRMYARVDGSRDIFVVEDKLAKLADLQPMNFRDPVLSRMETDQVDRVILRNGPGLETEIQRDATGWKLTKPLAAPADTETVERFLDGLLATRILEIVGNDSGDLGVHGIEEGKREVAFYVEGRDTPLVLRFGNVAQDGSGSTLAQFTGRDVIARLPAASRDVLALGPDEFRDRRLLPIDLDMVDLIRVSGPEGASFEIRRKHEGWITLRDGRESPVSPAVIQSVVSALTTTRVQEFLRRAPESAGRKIEFFSVLSENTPESPAGENLVAGLTFGATSDEVVEAVISDRPGAVSVPSAILSVIPGDVAAWCLPVASGEE